MEIDFEHIENKFKADTNGKCSVSDDGMIATQSGYATDIGKNILNQGGNAVDAAIASAFALGASEPQASGLGGQTMILIGNDSFKVALDGSSRAPSLAHAGSIYRGDRAVGYRATTVPSTPATLWYAHQQYGKLPWEQILEQSIELAQNGYEISALQERLLQREEANFNKVESHSGLSYFFNNGVPYREKEIFKQPELAELLKKLSEKGIKEFYRGTTAKQIDADMRKNGGLLRYDDLSLIPYPIEREPLTTTFRGVDIFTMPPPGAGETLLFALKMIEFMDADYVIENDNHFFHIIINVIRKAFLERKDRPFDANFFAQIADEAKMLSDSFAYESIREIIADVNRKLLPIIPSLDEAPGDTTHLSVIDSSGLAVSLTQSIERVYGSKAVADGLGFLYNNYLYDFDYEYPEHPYYIRPNAYPWATVAPTLIYNNNSVWMSLGSPGSERIVSSLLLFLLRIADNKYSLDEAMMAPRLHCSLGGRVSFEAGRFDPSLLHYLKQQEYRIDEREDYAFYLGCIQAVAKKQMSTGFQGVADIRRDGTVR